jgi:hypothetical protein
MLHFGNITNIIYFSKLNLVYEVPEVGTDMPKHAVLKVYTDVLDERPTICTDLPLLYSTYWLLHVSAVACHHQGACGNTPNIYQRPLIGPN